MTTKTAWRASALPSVALTGILLLVGYHLGRLQPLINIGDATSAGSEVHSLIYTDVSSDDNTYYGNLLQLTETVCGKLCDYVHFQPKASVSNIFWEPRRVPGMHDTCKGILQTSLFDAPAVRQPPPTAIPEPMRYTYTLGGRVEVQDLYMHQVYAGKTAQRATWSVDYINSMIDRYNSGDYSPCSYTTGSARDIHDALRGLKVKGKTALVVGTELPWLEALLLTEGAKMVYTLEYGSIVSEHPQLKSLLPHEFSAQAREGSLPTFDIIVSYSSLEHSGLGRYGDIPNPHGDVISIARLWCIASPHTVLLLGLPDAGNYNKDNDMLFWNAHRVYGPLRWPIVTSNWEPIGHHNKDKGEHGLYSFRKLG